MSNQRSCILFIALVIILFYLYYESIQKKAPNETKEKLIENASIRIRRDEPKVLFGRQLLSYSTEDTTEIQSVEIWSGSKDSSNFRALNTFPEASHKNKYLKRTKRNVKHRKGIYKWKFNVSVSKLDNVYTKPTDNLKNSFEEDKIEDESLNVEIYVDGKTKQFKYLEHSWHAVKDSLRNFYRESNESRGKDVFNSQDASTEIDRDMSVTKENIHLNSSENSLSLTDQKSLEKSVQVETKKVNSSSRGREAKFLFLDFGGGGNKENPPLLPEIGENVVNEVTTGSMHNLSILNSTEQFDIKIEAGSFSSTLLPEHQKLDIPLAEPNLSLTTISDQKLDSKIKVAKHNAPKPTVSNENINCDDCTVDEVRPSIEFNTTAEDKKAVSTEINMATNLPIGVIDISPDSIQMFCLNFVQTLRKAPRFEDEVTDTGSGNLGVGEEIESLRVTAEVVTTTKTQQQLGLLQRLWNRIPNFRSRNQRKVVEDLDTSRFPTDFSVQDCKDLFTQQIKFEFGSQTTSEESLLLTETKITTFISPNSEIKNSPKNNIDSFQKANALSVDKITKITSVIAPDFTEIPIKPTTKSTSNIFQTVPLFRDQILTTGESNMVNSELVEKSELSDNLNKITLAEESLKVENSVEQPKVLTAINTESSISLNTRSQNTISSETSEDLTIPLDFQQDKRFFSDLNNDDILELGSSDERSDDVTIKHENDLKEDTFDQKPSLSERFIPNFFNVGSGARELPESLFSTNININKNELSLSETSVSKSIFIESEDTKEVDFMQTPGTDEARRFIPNFFSGGSGARELPEPFFSTDNINKNEFSLSETNVQSVSDSIFIESTKKTIDFMQTPGIDEGRRFIPNFFSNGSGAREIPESVFSTDNINKNEFSLSETNVQSVSNSIFIEIENTTVDFMQTSGTDGGRRFIPNFFNGGSGAREIPESLIHTDTIDENEFSLSETKVQSIPDNIFQEEENALKATVDLMLTPLTSNERRFIPNFFSEGSGARELPESFISTDFAFNTNEINMSSKSFKKTSGGIFLEGENALKETTVDFSQTPISDKERRFIPNFFSEGSGGRELPEISITVIVDKVFSEELSEKKTSNNISTHDASAIEPFDMGSGERNLDEIESTIEPKAFDISSPSDNVSFPDFLASFSDTDNLIKEEIITDILPRIETDPPDHDEAFVNEMDEGFLTKNKDNSGQNSILRGSGEGRDISEISFNHTAFISDKGEIPVNNISNVNAFILSSKNTSHSTICNDCEELKNDKFPTASESWTTPCIDCSYESTETSESRNDDLLTAEIPPSKNNKPYKEVVTSFSQDSVTAANSKFSNLNNPAVIRTDLLNKDKVHFDTEISIQLYKSPPPNRGARFNDILPQDTFVLSSTLDTISDLSSHSNLSPIVDSIDEADRFDIDKIHLKPESKISSNSLSRRGPRFDDIQTVETVFTSKSGTTLSAIEMSVPPTKSLHLNSFQSRRGARGHDLFDLEKLDAEFGATEPKEETVTVNTSEEVANTLTEIETAFNDTLTVENHNDLTKSTDTKEIFKAISPDLTTSLASHFSDPSSVTSSIQPFSSTEKMNFNPELKLPPLKFCNSASVCNVTLNERCMPNNNDLICNCGKSFRRNLSTKKCEATITVQTSITLPGEKFHEDLRNNDTKLYQQKRMDYIKIMWFLLRHDPKLFRTVAEVDIAGFEEGSLIVNYTLKLLDNSDEPASEMIQLLQGDLNKIINDQKLLKNETLVLKNATLSVRVLNPCSSSDMNYCHKNALCIPTEGKGFKCQCKADYSDNSTNKSYPGENCTEVCDPNYCGNHGNCYIIDKGEKVCRCHDWYLGERCEISGLNNLTLFILVAIAGFAFVSFLVISCVCLVLFYRKKNSIPQLRTRNMTNFQLGQDVQPGHPTRDVQGLDEFTHHCRMSKYCAISTPIYEAPNPTIQITSPSFTGSSIDYDSTFDRSRYNSGISSNENSVAPKV